MINADEGCFRLILSCDPFKGAQVDVQDTAGWTALKRASYWGYADLVDMLLAAGQYTHTDAET